MSFSSLSFFPLRLSLRWMASSPARVLFVSEDRLAHTCRGVTPPREAALRPSEVLALAVIVGKEIVALGISFLGEVYCPSPS